MKVITMVAAVVSAAALTAGCGGGSSSPKDNGESKKPAADVANDAANALQQTGAVHLTGTQTTDGQSSPIDLRLAGDNVTGTVTLEGQPVTVTAIGTTTYFKAPAAFWSAQKLAPAAATALNDRWVKMPASDSDSLTSQLSFAKVVDRIRKPSGGKTINPTVTSGNVNGQRTVVLTQSDGSTVDVAATGQPLPLHVVNRSQGGADVVLSEFGVQPTITAPPGALDLAQLQG